MCVWGGGGTNTQPVKQVQRILTKQASVPLAHPWQHGSAGHSQAGPSTPGSAEAPSRGAEARLLVRTFSQKISQVDVAGSCHSTPFRRSHNCSFSFISSVDHINTFFRTLLFFSSVEGGVRAPSQPTAPTGVATACRPLRSVDAAVYWTRIRMKKARKTISTPSCCLHRHHP